MPYFARAAAGYRYHGTVNVEIGLKNDRKRAWFDSRRVVSFHFPGRGREGLNQAGLCPSLIRLFAPGSWCEESVFGRPP